MSVMSVGGGDVTLSAWPAESSAAISKSMGPVAAQDIPPLALKQPFSTANLMQLNQLSASPALLMESSSNSSDETPPEEVRLYNPDGSGLYEVLNPNGTFTTVFPPGFVDQTTLNPDGSSTTRISTGAELVTSPDGRTESWYRPDETLEYRKNPDGSTDHYDPDGSLFGTENGDCQKFCALSRLVND